MKLKHIGNIYEDGIIYEAYKNVDNGVIYRIVDGEAIEIKNQTDIDTLKLSEKVSDKVNKEKLKVKRAKRIEKGILTLACIGLLGITSASVAYFNKEKIEFMQNVNDQKSRYDYLRNALMKNNTVSGIEYDEFIKYIDYLSKKDIKDSKIVEIGYRLSKYDFSYFNVNSISCMYEALKEILNVDDNGFLADQLYSYISGNETFNSSNLIANVLVFEKNIDERLLNGESLSSILKQMFNKSYELGNFSKNDAMELDYIKEELESCLITDDDISLYNFNHNVCSDYLIIRYDNRIDLYGLYEDGQIKDLSEIVYKEKISKLINEDGKYIDYKNANDRFLVYLYANAIINYVKFEGDFISYLYDGAYNSEIFPAAVSKNAMFEYFTTGNLDCSFLPLLAELASIDTVPLGLIQEVNYCLKEEVECGNMNKELYDLFIESVCEMLKNKDEIIYNKFIDSTLKEEVVDGYKLELFNEAIF